MPRKPSPSPSTPRSTTARTTVIGRRRITRLPKTLRHPSARDLSAGYAAMAADQARETEATAWTEALIIDIAGEPTDPR